MTERDIRFVAVINIGKTIAKVALVDLQSLSQIALEATPNLVVQSGPYPHFDEAALWTFIQAALKKLNLVQSIEAVSITTHGAAAALLDQSGNLLSPVLDYEYNGPEDLAAQYQTMRPDFSQTGSPLLPLGLNLGAQIHWLFATQNGLKQRTQTILTWPQYWGFRLTGVKASEVTSLGCHTDLWNPHLGQWSSLPSKLGCLKMLPDLKAAGDVLGVVLPEIAALLGLPSNIPVMTGMDDINASLYPHLMSRDAPFALVSTGHSVIAMSVRATEDQSEFELDPARDTLITVNAFGRGLPSARFMGGREFDIVHKKLAAGFVQPSNTDVASVLDHFIMVLPAIEPHSGPFQGTTFKWTHREKTLTDGQRMAALSFYLSMMTATCLEIIAAAGPITVEGPFAKNRLYVSMLEAACGRPVIAQTGSAASPSISTSLGTTIGTALLAGGAVPKAAFPHRVQISATMDLYAALWRERCATHNSPK
jgi:sugar (pentulose or hexulose) kinase